MYDLSSIIFMVLPLCLHQLLYFSLSCWNCVASASTFISSVSMVSVHSIFTKIWLMYHCCPHLRTNFLSSFNQLLYSIGFFPSYQHFVLIPFSFCSKDSCDLSYHSVSLKQLLFVIFTFDFFPLCSALFVVFSDIPHC